MAGNVLSWGVALSKGYEPRDYSYVVEQVLIGEYEAVLDFKIWAKKILGIGCYFTACETGQKFQLTVYCQHGTGLYRIKGSSVDFAQCPVDIVYRIGVIRNLVNGKKRIVLARAVQI